MAKARKSQGIPFIEWVAAATGAFIALALFGFLIAEAIDTPADVPPVMEAVPVGLWHGGKGYVVEVRVDNRSRKTGAAVEIEGKLMDGQSEVETSGATISYVPGESRRRAGLVFREDPRRHRLLLRVTGYEEP